MSDTETIRPRSGDALIVVDVQQDFLPGGALAVAEGDRIVPVLNRYIEQFQALNLPVYATRDWHPPDHCSFRAQGGVWPPHCVAGTDGAAFAPDLHLPDDAVIISKATTVDKDAYSGLEGTDLADRLHAQNIKRLFVGGLATDYCVLNTVKDALRAHYQVLVLRDAVRAVDAKAGDRERAEQEMLNQGARFIDD